MLVKLVRFHVDDVDDTLEFVFFSDWQRERHDRPIENIVRAIQRDSEIRMLLIEFRYHHHPGQHELIRVSPGFFGLHLDAFDAVDDYKATIGDAHCGSRM